MANYHSLKNAAILTPTANQDLGSDANRYSNVFMSGNIVMSNGVTVTSTNVITPKIASLTLPGTETAVATAGGQTVTITGSGFNNIGGTPSVLIGSTPASSVTYISTTSLTFTTPPLGTGVYVLYVINSDAGAGIFAAGLNYSGTPTWSTAAGSLGSIGTGAAGISLSVAATGDAPVTYAVKAGSSLPAGLSLNSSTGAITGTAPVVANETTYNFTLTATDLQNQTTDRAFSISVVVIPSSLQFIVVAGGGSGGGYGGGSGGGGAGGYRSSITGESSGRGESAESALTGITSGVTYTITVGAGGASVVGEETSGFKGVNSSISGSGITTITSLGGGAGGPNSDGNVGRKYISPDFIGNGGSGGGAAQMMGNPVIFGAGTTGQGYDCGTNDSNGNGSGGGGAGGQGGAASTLGFGGVGVKSNVTISFTGTASVSGSNNTLTVTAVSAGIIDVGTQVTGTGIPAGSYIISRGTGTGSTGTYYMNVNGTATNTGVAITSTGRYYAGGGAGNNAGYGGAGGGGAYPGQSGAIANCTLNGAENTGGGGGGQNPSGAGGKGIVIIRHPTSVTATCTGSPIITTSGGYTVYQFTSSGTMIF